MGQPDAVRTSPLFFSGRPDVGFGAVSAVGPALDLEDDGSLHEAIEEGHGQRAVGQVLAPLVEVDVGYEGGRVLLVSSGNDLLKQMSRLWALVALDLVEPEFVDDEEVRRE